MEKGAVTHVSGRSDRSRVGRNRNRLDFKDIMQDNDFQNSLQKNKMVSEVLKEALSIHSQSARKDSRRHHQSVKTSPRLRFCARRKSYVD